MRSCELLAPDISGVLSPCHVFIATRCCSTHSDDRIRGGTRDEAFAGSRGPDAREVRFYVRMILRRISYFCTEHFREDVWADDR